ncbi:MAG: class I SAM-dependent methyltransferase [Candidatus Hermodarchaeota archaeon]
MTVNDIFGTAISEFSKDNSIKLELIKKDKTKFSIDLGYYFRGYNELSKLEKRAISLARGDILDVGCATGYYIPRLILQGKVDAIDISEQLINLANANGIEECRVADIFKYSPRKKYDTITLFENNIGLAGTYSKTSKMFTILTTLLKNNGQIIAIIRHTDYRRKYYSSKYKISWKGKIYRKGFRWLYFNIGYLQKFCNSFNLKLKIVDEEEDEGRQMYLVRLLRH